MQGHIHERTRTLRSGKTSTRWYVVVDIERTGDGRRRQKWHGGYPTRQQAEEARAQLLGDRHGSPPSLVSGTTLRDWVVGEWLPMMRTQLKPSTWDSYRRNLRLHVLPALGRKRLGEITRRDLNRLYGELLESGHRCKPGGLSPKTVRYIHTTISKALADAAEAGELSANPAERAKPPRIRPTVATELRFWTAKQLARFLEEACKHRLAAAWRLAAMTGMRRGEVLGLRWIDVDLQAACLSVRHTLISVAYEIQTSTPKTHRARVVDLDPQTVMQLEAHRDRQRAERQSCGPAHQDHGLVFARPDGTPLHPDVFSQTFERIVRRAGLPRIRLHDLRHTHATLAIKAGVPIRVVSERLGHQSPAFTLRQYAHVIPGMQAEAAAQVATLIDNAATAASTAAKHPTQPRQADAPLRVQFPDRTLPPFSNCASRRCRFPPSP